MPSVKKTQKSKDLFYAAKDSNLAKNPVNMQRSLFHLISSLRKNDRQCMYNVILRQVRVTVVAVEKQ